MTWRLMPSPVRTTTFAAELAAERRRRVARGMLLVGSVILNMVLVVKLIAARHELRELRGEDLIQEDR